MTEKTYVNAGQRPVRIELDTGQVLIVARMTMVRAVGRIIGAEYVEVIPRDQPEEAA